MNELSTYSEFEFINYIFHPYTYIEYNFQFLMRTIKQFEKRLSINKNIVYSADRLNNQKPLLDQDVEENFDSLSDLCKVTLFTRTISS